MQRYKRSQQDETAKRPDGVSPTAEQATATSSKDIIAHDQKEAITTQAQSPKTNGAPTPYPDATAATLSRGRNKGKRKVTFDVEPAVVTINKDEKIHNETPGEDPRGT